MAIEYSPKNAEIAVYEGLWKVASAPSGGADLSGTQAVEFFRKSGVDLGILKQIWTISTPVATMSMQQFYTALRLITMVQNGDIPLSRGTFSIRSILCRCVNNNSRVCIHHCYDHREHV